MKLEYLASGSSEGPLIRIYAFSRVEVHSLRELVQSVSSGPCKSVDLEALPWVEPIQGCRVRTVLGDRDRGVRQTVSANFECLLSSNGWQDVEGLLDPFCESDVAGFQWLTNKGKVALLFSHSGEW
jgi:hypothetical protein